MDLDEIWHVGGPQGQKVLGGVSTQHLPPPGYEVHKGGTGCLWSHSRDFWQKLFKTKVA